MGLMVSVTVTPNLKTKIESLRMAGVEINSKASAIVRESAFAVTASAKNLVPVSTGALSRSIQPNFFNMGLTALIGSWLPYAARQEYDASLNHDVRSARKRVNSTKAGRPGTIIKGTDQSNPNATFGFLRKSLYAESGNFIAKLEALVYNTIIEKWGEA